MKRQGVRSDQIPYSKPGAQRRRRSRKKPEPTVTVTVRKMTDDEFDALQAEKMKARSERLARRRKALEVLGTTPKAERAAQKRPKGQTRSAEVAAQIDAGETVSQKPSDYKRKIKRK